MRSRGLAPWMWVGVWALVGSGSLAWADVVHLRNGRKVEGTITKRTRSAIHIKLRAGKMILPRSIIKRVETRTNAQREYEKRIANTNLEDTKATLALATWAASRGLGREARDLTQLAHRVRLDRMVAKAERLKTGKAFVEVFYWARRNGLANETQLWLLAKADRTGTQVKTVRYAYRVFARALAREEARLVKLEEIRKRPRYVMPINERAVGGRIKAVVTAHQIQRLWKVRALRQQAAARAKAPIVERPAKGPVKPAKPRRKKPRRARRRAAGKSSRGK